MSDMGLSVIIFIINSIEFFLYAQRFLKRKYGKGKTVVIGGFLYLLIQIVVFEIFGRYYAIGKIAGILFDICFLSLLQILFFRREMQKQFFITFSFMAGKECVKYLASVLAFILGDIWNSFFNVLIEKGLIDTVEKAKLWTTISVVVNLTVCALVYALFLSVYLYFISRKFVRKAYRFSFHENIFLILPCVAALCICITLKIMVVSVENGLTVLIYESVPITKFWIPVICILLLSTIIACVALFQKLVQLGEEVQKRAILENQVAQMQREAAEIQDIYADMRGLKHDMRSHLANILILAGKGADAENEELKKYIGEMENTIDRLNFAYQTGNPITDIIIHQKKQVADKQQIRFDVRFSYPKELHIDVYDIAVVLNNALENALEACHDMQTDKYIRLHSYVRGNLFFIEIENTFSHEIAIAEESGLPASSKERREAHGIGLSNIRRCARKYMGDTDIVVTDTDEGKIFNLTVMMNGKQFTPKQKQFTPNV